MVSSAKPHPLQHTESLSHSILSLTVSNETSVVNDILATSRLVGDGVKMQECSGYEET